MPAWVKWLGLVGAAAIVILLGAHLAQRLHAGGAMRGLSGPPAEAMSNGPGR